MLSSSGHLYFSLACPQFKRYVEQVYVEQKITYISHNQALRIELELSENVISNTYSLSYINGRGPCGNGPITLRTS